LCNLAVLTGCESVYPHNITAHRCSNKWLIASHLGSHAIPFTDFNARTISYRLQCLQMTA